MGWIFNNKLFFKNNMLLFPIVFWKFLWGDKALMEGYKVMIGGSPQSPHKGKPCKRGMKSFKYCFCSDHLPNMYLKIQNQLNLRSFSKLLKKHVMV